MSRRTKLIITPLLLMMLVVPVGYLCLSWSPAGPLRFSEKTPAVMYRIMVENASDVPMQISSPEVEYPIPAYNPVRRPLTAEEVDDTNIVWRMLVQPRGRVTTNYLWGEGRSPDDAPHSALCFWASPPKAVTVDVIHRIEKYSPATHKAGGPHPLPDSTRAPVEKGSHSDTDSRPIPK